VTDRSPEPTEVAGTEGAATEEKPAAAAPTKEQRVAAAPTAEERVAAAPTEEERRRRRAAVFGDVLPEATSDDRADPSERGRGGGADGYGGGDGEDPTDEWLRREVPPHHG
jgi:hypothetical protein